MQESLFVIISEVMDVPVGEISMDSSPDTIGSWDSLNHMNLVFALEEEYGVKFSDETIVKMMDVETILGALKELSSGAGDNA